MSTQDKLAAALRMLHRKLKPNVNGADETYFFIGLREQVSEREMRQVSEALAAHDTQRQQAEAGVIGALFQHGETGRTRVVMRDEVADCDARWFKVGDLVLATAAAAPVAAEPVAHPLQAAVFAERDRCYELVAEAQVYPTDIDCAVLNPVLHKIMDQILAPAAPAPQPVAAEPVAWRWEHYAPSGEVFNSGISETCVQPTGHAYIHEGSGEWVGTRVTPLYAAPVPQQVAGGVPEGYALVPVEPTRAMLDALRTGSRKDYPSDELCRVRYAAMLSAAPQPTASQAGSGESSNA